MTINLDQILLSALNGNLDAAGTMFTIVLVVFVIGLIKSCFPKRK